LKYFEEMGWESLDWVYPTQVADKGLGGGGFEQGNKFWIVLNEWNFLAKWGNISFLMAVLH